EAGPTASPESSGAAPASQATSSGANAGSPAASASPDAGALPTPPMGSGASGATPDAAPVAPAEVFEQEPAAALVEGEESADDHLEVVDGSESGDGTAEDDALAANAPDGPSKTVRTRT